MGLVVYLNWSAYAMAAGFVLLGFFYSLGLGPVSFPYVGEVFDTETRGKGVGLALSMGRFTVAVYALLIPTMLDPRGLFMLLLYFFAINVFGAFYMFFLCP